MRQSRLWFVVVALAAALPACGGTSGGNAPGNPPEDGGPTEIDEDSGNAPGKRPKGAGPPGIDEDSGVSPTCIEEQVTYVLALLPLGDNLSVAEAVQAVLAHPEFTREMPYCSGMRP
jgi:hypothetical protein